MLFNNILETIGNTPLIKLNEMAKNHQASLYAKCEFFNPGGSVKDRPAYNMIKQAEKEGRIKPGDTLIEPTSGNTGIGLAFVGNLMGYKVIVVMPEKMSEEKAITIRSLGAKIVRTPTEVAHDDPRSHISVAKKLESQDPHFHILDQYSNPTNPESHYKGTGNEILKDLKGKVDMVVMGAGTGGTLTGITKRISEDCPQCEFIGVDPEGSSLAGETTVSPYEVEGIGYDFIPDVLDRSLVTKWVKTTDKDAFKTAREAIKKEGFLCGGSSGSALWAALQESKKLKEGQNCVVILPDGIRNYMSKFLDDKWLNDKGLL